MTGPPLSRAASGLFRALLHRVEEARHRILLIEASSVDWQSLTFTGERHQIALRITGPGAGAVLAAPVEGLADAEFEIAGHIVADIAALPAVVAPDGSVSVRIEALTLAQ